MSFGLHVFVCTNDRHKKGKKEYGVHYVKEGPKVDTTCKEAQYALPTEPAGDCIAIYIMHVARKCVFI